MKKIAVISFVGVVFVLGYSIYAESRAKKREEILNIIHDAEKGIHTIETNPNHLSHQLIYHSLKKENF